MIKEILIIIGVSLPTIGVILWFVFRKGLSHFLDKAHTKYKSKLDIILETYKKDLNLTSKKEFDLYLIERDRYEHFVEEIEKIFTAIKDGTEGEDIDMEKLKILFYKMALTIPDETVKAIKALLQGMVTEKEKVKVYIELRKALLKHVSRETSLSEIDIPEDFKGTVTKKRT